MEKWEDQGIVLAVRGHGENGGVVSLLTESHGRHGGYVRGARGSRMRGTLEVGNIVDASWQSRVADNLGSFTLELQTNTSAHVMDEALKLSAIQSACALCDAALPEREGHAGLFHGLNAMFGALSSEVWAEGYVMWEIALLRELGFSLGLSECAGGGDNATLAYVSPKTGRAVSRDKARGYEDKLIVLPQFLGGVLENENDVLCGLQMTAYFLEHWAFAHHTKGMPEARVRLQGRFEKKSKTGQLSVDDLKQAL